MRTYSLLTAIALGGLALSAVILWLARWLEVRRASTAPRLSIDFPRRSQPAESLTFESSTLQESIGYQIGQDFVTAVGASNYQLALRRLFDEHDRGAALDVVVTATLLPEPDNVYDSNAVAVLVDGEHVGYLPREVAKSYHTVLARQSAFVTCPAKLTGGRSAHPAIGIVLDFATVRLLKPGRRAQ